MRLSVGHQDRGLGEPLAALRTHVGLLLRVDSFVSVQIGHVVKLAPALMRKLVSLSHGQKLGQLAHLGLLIGC